MKYIYLLVAALIVTSCQDNSIDDPNCQFLLDIGINEIVNLGLLPGSNLSSGTSVLIESATHRGIIVTQIGASSAGSNVTYYAWDAADPNHTFSGCKLLPTNNFGTYGLTATCSCEGNEYSLVTGQALGDGNLPCGLRFYRVTKSGNTLIISN